MKHKIMSTIALPPYLTDAEIDEICAPLKIGAAKRKRLERMGMLVKTKPNGRPLVARAEFERVMTGSPVNAAAQANSGISGPNVLGLQDYFRRRKHGSRT